MRCPIKRTKEEAREASRAGRERLKAQVEEAKARLDATGRPRLLRMPEVIASVGFSRSRVYELIKSGEFPKGVKLGGNARAWPSDKIGEFIAARAAA
jgi:prophage regulatory protein